LKELNNHRTNENITRYLRIIKAVEKNILKVPDRNKIKTHGINSFYIRNKPSVIQTNG